jgi:hypothetical protein
MNWLGRRITSLESFTPPEAPCLTCGYPRKRAPKHITLRRNGPLDRCMACGRCVDDDGLPLQNHTKIIVLGPPDGPTQSFVDWPDMP